MMKIFAFALGLLFLSTPAFAGVGMNVTLDGSDQVRFARYLEAVREVEKVINSEEFKGLIYEKTYSSTKKTSSQVMASIYEAEEILIPGKNGIWEWKVGFYYPKNPFSKVIGWTNPKTMTVWVNKKKFDGFDLWDIADNIAHEYLHKIGFGHSSASDRTSVPYAVGYIVRDLVRKNLTAIQEPTPAPIPDPVKDPVIYRPSFWSRLKSYLFGG